MKDNGKRAKTKIKNVIKICIKLKMLIFLTPPLSPLGTADVYVYLCAENTVSIFFLHSHKKLMEVQQFPQLWENLAHILQNGVNICLSAQYSLCCYTQVEIYFGIISTLLKPDHCILFIYIILLQQHPQGSLCLNPTSRVSCGGIHHWNDHIW